MITITLQQILAARPCYDPIVRYGLEGMDRDAPISFREIVEVAGGQDAIWCFAMALPGQEALKRHFAVDCAERVRHLMGDPRSLAALEVARRHAQGMATDEDLTLAQSAAEAAVADVQAAAWADAWADAWTAEAAWAAARAALAAAWADEAVWAAAWAAAKAADARYIVKSDARYSQSRRAAEVRWQGQRLIEITEAGAWTPVEEADKRR